MIIFVTWLIFIRQTTYIGIFVSVIILSAWWIVWVIFPLWSILRIVSSVTRNFWIIIIIIVIVIFIIFIFVSFVCNYHITISIIITSVSISYIIDQIIHCITSTIVVCILILIEVKIFKPTVNLIVSWLFDILPPYKHKIILKQYPRQTYILLESFAIDGQV